MFEKNKLNDDIRLILDKNITSILKLLYQQNPTLFLNQFYTFDQNNDTFFKLLAKNYSITPDVIDFLLDKGFDFTKNFFNHEFFQNDDDFQKTWSNRLEKNNDYQKKRTYSEFLNSALYLNDNTLLHLMKKIHSVDSTYFKKLESQDYFLLHKFISYKPNTFAFLYSIGLDPNKANFSGYTVERYAAQTSQHNVYLTYSNTVNKNDINISNSLSWVQNKNKFITKLSESLQEEVILFYKNNLNKHTIKEQEQLIALSITTESPNFYKKIFKAINIKPKEYNPTHFPLWMKLEDIKSPATFYDLCQLPGFDIRAKIETDLVENDIEKYLIYHIAQYNSKQRISSKSDYKYSKSNDDRTKHKIYQHIEKLITPDFLIEKMPQNNNLTWFEFILEQDELRNPLKNYLKNITIENEQQAINFIKNTWLKKNKNDIPIILEDLAKINYFTFTDIPTIISADIINKTFTIDDKKHFLNLFFSNQHNMKEHLDMFKNVFDYLVTFQQNEVQWDNFIENDKKEKNFKIFFPDLYDSYISLKEFQLLQKKLPTKAYNHKNNFKI